MPTEQTSRGRRVGVALAAAGAISYGVTVIVGRDLADAGFGPETSLGVRFMAGGVVLALVLRARGVSMFPSRREVLAAAGLGLLYAVESTFFFSSLQRSTASATALVFYVYPAMVTIFEVVRGREQAHRSTFAALALSICGSALVVTAGGSLSTTAAGVAFALAAAATFSIYLLAGREVGLKTDPMVIACWVSIGAGAANLARGVLGQALVNPSDHAAEMVIYGVATATAFTLTFAAMRLIGAARVAVVMTLEAVSTVVLAAVFLDERVTFVQGVGGVAVLGAATVIARSQPVDTAVVEAEAPSAGT